MILIISDPIDGHARLVRETLAAKGHDAALLDLSEFPRRARASAWVERMGTKIRVKRDRKPELVDLDAVSAVWFRRIGNGARASDALAEEDQDFARNEATCFLISIGTLLGDRFWVNPMTAAAETDRGHGKIAQLELARRIGLEVPRTLATNDPVEARAFVESCEGSIYKPFRSPTRNRDASGRKKWSVIYTNKLDEKALARIEGVQYAPCLFQEYIEKKLELRITVIGNKAFAVEIHSQVSDKSAIDFRRNYDLGNVPYVAHALPRALEDKLVALHAKLGIVFGAVDMILTPDGRYVFLEDNQQGQFLWLEEMVGLPLLENFCALLTQRRIDYACDAAAHAPGPFRELEPLDPRDEPEDVPLEPPI